MKNQEGKKMVEIGGRVYKMRKYPGVQNETPIAISDRMTGKMEGVMAVGTSHYLNKFCIARMENGDSICASCLANKAEGLRLDLHNNLVDNYYLLTGQILPTEYLPKFLNQRIVRIEAFGDVENEIQAINYLNIIRKNPKTVFGWWSKNMPIIKRAIDATGGKPNNLILVESSPILNVQKPMDNEYVDKIFTVYNQKTIISDNININCGGRKCADCMRCYKKRTGPVINEKLK